MDIHHLSLFHSVLLYYTSSSAVADEPTRRCIMANGKILKRSRDHNHALFVGAYVILLLELIEPTCVQNSLTLGSAVPVIRWKPQNF